MASRQTYYWMADTSVTNNDIDCPSGTCDSITGFGGLDGEYYYMIGHTSGCGEAIGGNKVQNASFSDWTAGVPDSFSLVTGTVGKTG